MALREKYNYAIQTAKNFHMDGNADERDGKLHFKGTVKTQDEANKIWDAIKTIPTWQKDVVADIRVTGGPSPGQAHAPAPADSPSSKTYTVKAGDTLSRIAKDHLGNAADYMKIFNLNKDQLANPDLIKPGQVLRLP